MGSFDYTCTVTGLPISAGTPVRFLLLTENPYHTPADATRQLLGGPGFYEGVAYTADEFKQVRRIYEWASGEAEEES